MTELGFLRSAGNGVAGEEVEVDDTECGDTPEPAPEEPGDK